jgi:hypothetical protein
VWRIARKGKEAAMIKPNVTTLMRVVVITAACIALAGCTHQLACKNIGDYKPTALGTVSEPLTIGLVPIGGDEYGDQLIRHVRDALILRYNAKVILPYLPGSSESTDIVATLSVKPKYEGSGWNFLVNFPGFLVFVPALNGYVYQVSYNTSVVLQNTADKTTLATFDVPITLNLRHADINRTWTEVSWLEWGVIAFVGGIVFTQYDSSVSPIVMKDLGPQLGEYLATEIMNRVKKSGQFAFRVHPREWGDAKFHGPLSFSRG